MKPLTPSLLITLIVSLAMLVKMFLFGVGIGDSLAALFILAAVQVSKVIDYKFPKRADLFQEVETQKKKIEELESDVTALKFGNIRR